MLWNKPEPAAGSTRSDLQSHSAALSNQQTFKCEFKMQNSEICERDL